MGASHYELTPPERRKRRPDADTGKYNFEPVKLRVRERQKFPQIKFLRVG
jgi:hypothetical protein